MAKLKTKKRKKLPELTFLLNTYDYNPITGVIKKKSSGKELGWDNSGYREMSIKGKAYKVHRIVFYMYHRRDPGNKVIDHIDGDKANNAIYNLRCVSWGENVKNTAAYREKNGLPKPEKGIGRALAMPVIDPTPDY